MAFSGRTGRCVAVVGRARGFTLIELMVVVLITSILAVLAIYGVRKYLANSRTVEARNTLGAITKAAASSVDHQIAGNITLTQGGLAVQTRRFCGSSTMVPSVLSKVSGVKYQSAITEWSTGDALNGWRCLRFQMEQPQLYAYTYAVISTDATTGSFSAQAFGDLNGDGIYGTFTLLGQANNGVVAVSPNIQETNPEE